MFDAPYPSIDTKPGIAYDETSIHKRYEVYGHRSGFTIVELLIVIVVLGVLMTIVAVAYNGLQARARKAAIETQLGQINRKVLTHAAGVDAVYPDSLAEIGIVSKAPFTFSYSASNGTNPKTFCASVSDGTTVYKVDSASQTPVAGSCYSGSTAVEFSAQNAPNETAVRLFDGNSATKWLAFSSSGWVAFSTTVPGQVTSYTLTSADDTPGRDPASWTLAGSNDRINWTTINTQSGQTFATRFLTKSYTVTGAGTYAHYRMTMQSLTDPIIQLADISLSGSSGVMTVSN